MQFTTNLLGEIELLKQHNIEYSQKLSSTEAELANAKQDIEKLTDYVSELEVFKKKAIAEKSCRFCGIELPSVFHVHSHMRNCDSNPRKGEKVSVFEAVV